MCGRFVSASPPDELANYFGAELPDRELEPNFNVAPTTESYVVLGRGGHRQLTPMRWGLVPFWAKDAKIGAKMINARAETVFDKPAFRSAIRRHRCIVPVDGFYEWAKIPGQSKKQPYFIQRGDGEPLALAGVWERWTPPAVDGEDDGDPLYSFTILTCGPNETMSSIHQRMPVILAPRVWDEWIADGDNREALEPMLKPAPAGLLTLRPVTSLVNNVRNNGSELLEVDPAPSVVASE